MRPSVQNSYRRYGKFLGRARLIRIPGHLVLQTVNLPSYLTYGVRIGILPPGFGYLSVCVSMKLNLGAKAAPES
jgi:hypothetical protein